MIDTLGLPVSIPGNCNICKKWETEKKSDINMCHNCGKTIPSYDNMRGSGYESQSIDHWHQRTVFGAFGYKAIHKELCLECYREDWRKNNPDKELPL